MLLNHCQTGGEIRGHRTLSVASLSEMVCSVLIRDNVGIRTGKPSKNAKRGGLEDLVVVQHHENTLRPAGTSKDVSSIR